MAEEKKLTWLQLMSKNGYILFFALGLALIVLSYEIWYTAFDVDVPFTNLSFNGAWIPLVIGSYMTLMVVYKGFIQFWRDYSSGKSR